jgi:hypothetical protein
MVVQAGRCTENRKVHMGSGRRIVKIAAAAVLLMMIVSPACKKTTAKSRIEGNWTLRLVFPDNPPADLYLTFEGSETGGTVKNQKGTVLGSYHLAYPVLSFDVRVYYNEISGNLVYLFSGSLTDETNMSGTVVGYFSNFPDATLNGTWTGTR